MRSNIGLFWAFGFLIGTSPSLLDARSGPIYIPEWSEGMTWTIEHEPAKASNRRFSPVLPKPPEKLPGGKLPEKISGGSSDPTADTVPDARSFWEFEVERVVTTGRMKLYSVMVRPRDATKSTEADLVFAGTLDASGRQVKLFLLKALYRYPTKGGLSEIRREYNTMSDEAFPVVGDGNSIPLDFPCLYQVEPKESDEDGFWKEYQVSKSLFGEVYGQTVRQTLVLNTQKVRRPDRYQVALERHENQDIYLRLEPNGVVSRLVFNPRYPWPVYGEGPKGRFWLLPSQGNE